MRKSTTGKKPEEQREKRVNRKEKLSPIAIQTHTYSEMIFATKAVALKSLYRIRQSQIDTAPNLV